MTAKIIHRFGRAAQLDPDTLIRLFRSIARVCGVEVIDPLESDGHQGGLPLDVKILRTVDFGTVEIVEELWEQYGIGQVFSDLLRKSCHKKQEIKYARRL